MAARTPKAPVFRIIVLAKTIDNKTIWFRVRDAKVFKSMNSEYRSPRGEMYHIAGRWFFMSSTASEAEELSPEDALAWCLLAGCDIPRELMDLAKPFQLKE